MASLRNGRVNDFGNSTLSANTRAHTEKHVGPAKAFLACFIILPPLMAGLTICLHVVTLIAVSVCARWCACRGAFVRSTPPRHVLFPLVCVQAGREAVGRSWWKDCKMWMDDRSINPPRRSNTPNCCSLSSRKDNIRLQTSTLLLDFNRAISSNSHDCT